MVKHQNASGAYGQRVAECRRATEIMGVKSLRDATMDRLGLIEDPVVLRRARHVITENRRVEAFVEAAANGNVERMGGLFVESHRSMQFDYEISCEELDYLVDAAIAIDGVYGARMTGGGFGGCTVNLVDASAALAFEGRISGAYRARYGKEPAIYRIRPSGGASRLS
jgi:galactokinase